MEEKRELGITASPSVVIGLGQWGLEVISQLRGELTEVEPRLGLITSFGAVRGVGEGKIEAVLLTDPPIEGECVDMPRREGFLALQVAMSQVQGQIYEALRKVRTHQSLIAAGKRLKEVDLYVYIVANLSEGVSSGILLPLSYQVQRLLVDQPLHLVIGLLSIANFSPPLEQPKERAGLYAALKELDHFMRTPFAKPDVSKRMGLTVAGPPLHRCYLFDVTKEDGSLVEGPDELRSAVSCFLLSLLISSFEEEMWKKVSRLGVLERASFYSSAAAAVLSYPVDRAIDWCAAKLGSEFIEEEILNPSRLNLSALNEEGQRRGGEALSLRGWMGELVDGTPGTLVSDGPHLKLGVDRPRFGQIAKEDWADSIASLDSLFGTHRFPLYLHRLGDNALPLREQVLSRLSNVLDSALRRARLYPSGIPGARKILDNLAGILAKRRQELEEYSADFPQHPEGDLHALEEAALNFPSILALLARLVVLCALEFYLALILFEVFLPLLSLLASLLLCFLTIVGGLYWFKRKNDILIQKREKCMDNVECKYSLMLERRAIAEMRRTAEVVEGWVEEMRAELDALQESLEEARDKLRQGMDASLSAKDPFLRWAIDEEALGDLYLRFAPPKETMLHSLLDVEGLLDDWKNFDEEMARERLLFFGRNLFRRPLRNVSLDQMLQEQAPPSPEERLRPLLELAVPLLRFSFEGLGEGLSAYSEDFIALENRSSSVLRRFISEELGEADLFSTGDRYHIFLCRTRHLLPLVSIGTMNLLGEAYRKMDKEERRALHLFDEWADLPEPSVRG